MEKLIKSILLSLTAKDWLVSRFKQNLTNDEIEMLSTKPLVDYSLINVLKAFYLSQFGYWYLQTKFENNLIDADYKLINLANVDYININQIILYLILTKNNVDSNIINKIKIELISAISHKVTTARLLNKIDIANNEKQLLTLLITTSNKADKVKELELAIKGIDIDGIIKNFK